MINRRHFLQSAAAFGLARFAKADTVTQRLFVKSRILEVKGKAAKVFGITQDNGTPGLDLVYGSPFDVELHNDLTEPTAIHWHGLTPPTSLDGVPGLSAPAQDAGEIRHYFFDNKRVGTHWMHSHLGLQEQQLLAAPLIVREVAKPRFDDQEHVVMLHDFTFRDPAEILAELQAGGGGHAIHMDMPDMKMPAADHNKVTAMGNMVMAADVLFDAFLANDRTLDDPEVVAVEPGTTLRLRLINGAAATNLWIDLGVLKGQLIAVDGNAIKPLPVSRFPLAIAQRADVRITLPKDTNAWPILFQCEGAKLRGGIFLRAGNAPITKLSDQGEEGAMIGLDFETKLHAAYDPTDRPVKQREFVRLTGGRDGYAWGFNGKSMMHDVLFTVRKGERVELTMRNESSMAHPMHLHGHYFQVTALNGKAFHGAIRDTLLIPPNNTATVRFDADNPGRWAFHCHHLYHMNSGMMASMAYRGI